MDGSIIYRTRENLPYTDGVFSRAAHLTLVYNMKRCQRASQNWKISQLSAVRTVSLVSSGCYCSCIEQFVAESYFVTKIGRYD